MSIYSADDEDDNHNVDNGVRKGGHGPVTKQDDDVGHEVMKQDDDVGHMVMKQDVASEHQSGSNDSEGEEQIIIDVLRD